MTTQEYKAFLIADILAWQTNNQFTEKDLQGKTIRALEMIHDSAYL